MAVSRQREPPNGRLPIPRRSEHVPEEHAGSPPGMEESGRRLAAGSTLLAAESDPQPPARLGGLADAALGVSPAGRYPVWSRDWAGVYASEADGPLAGRPSGAGS